MRSRLADGATGIGTEGQRHEAGREGGGATTGRATGDTGQIPRVERLADRGVLSGRTHRELIHVQTTVEDGTGSAETLGHMRVIWRHQRRQHLAGARQRLTLNSDIILNRDGDAFEWAPTLSGLTARIGSVGLREHIRAIEVRECTDLFV